ncbi:hypothetical protein DFJ58DRAFT_849011 [Suillus subalutaceus]|uniref:uncharacterized protein n=1 Tax=Suillus subalutaceus TaxID=48586 RepID=UPI001B878481|nr:uncharacterized protein DFJ58DRAFT_849011 [Suillus subalutaceus]KAG1828589.1 hypothetical protein DFJ58DRAFT_849011 [Suillus subalutaceus]
MGDLDPVTKLSKNLSSRVDELLWNSSPFQLSLDRKDDHNILHKAKMFKLTSSGVGVKETEISKIELSRAAVSIAYATVNSYKAKVSPNPLNSDSQQREKLAKYFKTPSFGHISELTTFIDMHGRILAWHLPGTMVYIAGKVLEHGVPRWGDGERIVIAHFVKDKVHDKQGIPRPGLPMEQDFLIRVGAGEKEWWGGEGLRPGKKNHISRPFHILSKAEAVYHDKKTWMLTICPSSLQQAKGGKRAWLQVQTNPLYETLGGHSSSSSPKKQTKKALMEFPDSGTYDAYRETSREFVLEAEATQHARKNQEIILECKQFVCEGMCESCQDAEGTFSCVACTGDHGWCHPCMIKSHQSLPFLKIQLWISKCFKDVTLADLGFVWYLGHRGKPCPWYGASLLYDGGMEALPHDTNPVTIVHSSGVMHDTQEAYLANRLSFQPPSIFIELDSSCFVMICHAFKQAGSTHQMALLGLQKVYKEPNFAM